MRFAFVWLRAASLGAGLLCSISSLVGFTQSGTTFTTNGTAADIDNAVVAANAGDTITIPAGTFTWTNNAIVWLNKAVTLTGAGAGKTIIVLGPNEPTVAVGAIQIMSSATVSNLTIQQTGYGATPFAVNAPCNNWRITGVTFLGDAVSSYFCIVGAGYGIIDNCTLYSGGGENELVFARGPTNSWQVPDSMGTANAVYIENNSFNGAGYVCDANANCRMVVRYNKITGPMKVDAHGVASNSPARSVRQIEIYNNTWTSTAASFAAIELRGGTGIVFGNTTVAPINGAWFYLDDYGYLGQWPNFGSVYQTPVNYPIADQIGEGMDVNGARAPGGADPMYVFNNTRSGSQWIRCAKTPAAGALALYQQQTSNPAATFNDLTLIAADRDVFSDWTVAGTFNGTTGVGKGTFAQMSAIVPTVTGVGFWVTDQGHWNTQTSAASGQLYAWSGSAWVLKYTPYTYPNPLRMAHPAVTASATSIKAGQGATLSVAATANATYQWQYNGVNIPGATSRTLILSQLGAYQSGNYSAFVTVAGSSVVSAPVLITITQNARITSMSALDNLNASYGMNLSVGIAGAGSKHLLITTDGPTLGLLNVPNAISATRFSVYDAKYALVASDSGWTNSLVHGTSATTSASAASLAELQAVGSLPLLLGSLDSAMMVAAPASTITATATNVGYNYGVMMENVYDADPISASSYVYMFQAGGAVNYDGSILQVGFVISGSTSQTVLIYGLGPSNGTYGARSPLQDPRLTLFGSESSAVDGEASNASNSVMIAQNVGWGNPCTLGTSPYSVAAQPATTALMNAANAPLIIHNGTTDCAMVVTLPPGSYTVQVDSVSGAQGSARVEIMNLP